MTTNITINPAGHFVLVEIIDNYRSPGGLRSFSRSEQVIPPADKGGQPLTLYSTTTRTITCVDLNHEDERALEWMKNAPARAHSLKGPGGAEVDTSDTRQTRGLTDEFVSGLREIRTKSDY